MVVFNYSGAEINAKIVYYGPALSGKTTNLEYIYAKMPANAKGKMVSMKTRTDRTLFFDFLPLELGEINGYRTRILLYTVPGQVYYNATRKLVLKGADAVVFVADSDPAKMQENVDSLRNLEENLNEHGLTLDTIPWVIQYNKRDLPNALPVDTLSGKLNLLSVPTYEAVATTGVGIYETFQGIAGMLYRGLAERLEQSQPAPEAARAQAAPPAAAPQQPPAPAATPAPAPPAEPPAAEEDVSDVVDAALREVDIGEDIRNLDTRTNTRNEPQQATVDVAEDGDDESFQFESLEEEAVDDQVGRVVNLEDTQAGQATPDEFITDPFKSSRDEPKKKNYKPAPTAPAKGTVPRKRLEGDEAPAAPAPAAPATPAAAPPQPPEPQAPEPPAPLPVEQDAPALSERAPAEEEGVTVSVPVLLSRSQVSKSIPIKLKLEIQVLDDE